MQTNEELNEEIAKLNKKIELLIQAVHQGRTIKLKFNESAKLLKAKDKELKELNDSLEQRVRDEVESNRAKEEMLNQQSKMAAMGEMIGNIAHQWRQPLSVISTAASGIMMQKEYNLLTDEILNNSLEMIVKSTQFLSQTIEDFRNFFQPNKQKENFPVYRTINKALSMIEASFKNNNIDIILNLDESLSTNGFENEFIQAIINILNNAKDALKSNTKDNEVRLIFINLYKEDKQIVVNIKDNASGVPKDIIHKIFDPYFTTKHKSQGTGIGLYMTHEIIVKHFNGILEVQNETYEYNNLTYTGALFTIKVDLLSKERTENI